MAKTKSLTLVEGKRPLCSQTPRTPPKATSGPHSAHCQSVNNSRLGHKIQTPNQCSEQPPSTTRSPVPCCFYLLAKPPSFPTPELQRGAGRADLFLPGKAHPSPPQHSVLVFLPVEDRSPFPCLTGICRKSYLKLLCLGPYETRGPPRHPRRTPPDPKTCRFSQPRCSCSRLRL